MSNKNWIDVIDDIMLIITLVCVLVSFISGLVLAGMCIADIWDYNVSIFYIKLFSTLFIGGALVSLFFITIHKLFE